MTTDLFLIIPILLIAVAVLILLLTRRKRETLQMPPGETIYQDTQEQRGTILYSQKYHLKGRPDFLLRQGSAIIPVEAKTGKTPQSPYHSHIMQLMAYCVLVEENYGVRPAYGVVRYPERSFEIPFTLQRETELIKIVADMREKKKLLEVHRNHNSINRCASCGFVQQCDERLHVQTSLPLNI